MNLFYQKYYLRVTNFLKLKIDDPSLVEELANDILFSAYNSLPSFKNKSKESTWILSIANHKVIDYYRKKKIKTVLFSSSPFFEEIADSALTPERDVLKNELKTEIKKTFLRLGAGYRKILRLKYIDGLKLKDISKNFKLSLKATESLLIRARRQFQKKWTYDHQTSFSYRRSTDILPPKESVSSRDRTGNHSS